MKTLAPLGTPEPRPFIPDTTRCIIHNGQQEDPEGGDPYDYWTIQDPNSPANKGTFATRGRMTVAEFEARVNEFEATFRNGGAK